jgi:hypothetical protein
MVLTGGIDMNLIGATEASLEPTDGGPTLRLRSGRLVLGTTAADNRLLLQTPEVSGELMLADLRSLVALELTWRRPPGSDPEKVGASVPTLRIMSVQGSVHWKLTGSDPIPLEVGKQWSAIGKQQGSLSDSAEVSWVDPPTITTDLSEYARRGLLDQIASGTKGSTLLLRDATTNRRAEVVMLAGKTLLQLGEPEMYFGSDGLLSRVSQKAYWKDHFLALQEALDRSPEGASLVREAAQKLNTAEADILYRLLWGYSNEQLSRGEDARLVELLDHPNLAVRVLALENLRMITGTTLNYRPENEGRRSPDLVKWQARQRREGGIRWPQ